MSREIPFTPRAAGGWCTQIDPPAAGMLTGRGRRSRDLSSVGHRRADRGPEATRSRQWPLAPAADWSRVRPSPAGAAAQPAGRPSAGVGVTGLRDWTARKSAQPRDYPNSTVLGHAQMDATRPAEERPG